MEISTALLASVLIAAADPVPQSSPQTHSEGAPKPVSLDLPVTLDGILLGEIVAQIRGDDVSVRPVDIAALFEGQIDQESQTALRATSVSADGYASLEVLSRAGFTIVFDPESLTLKAELAADKRGVQEISLRATPSVDLDQGIAPANFSAGVTGLVRVARVHTEPGGNAGFEAVRADIFGFANFGGFDGWTLTWEADFDSGRAGAFRRRDVTIVKDNYDAATRLSIGDIRSRPLLNSQRSVDVLGVSYRRAYEDIQPFRTLIPRGQSSFTIERRSRVVVEVDGFVIFDQQLSPRVYSLQDFPLTTGSNNVVVTVDDGTGPREVSVFSAFIDADLLGEGLTRFDFNAGVLSNGAGADQRYGDDPVVTASFDRGISTSLTVGGHFEGSIDLAQASFRAALGTPFGLISGEVKGSRSSAGWGAAGIVQFRTQFETGQIRHNVAAQANWRNDKLRDLAGLQVMETSFDLRWLVQSPKLQVSADASYRKTQGTTRKSLAIGATWRMLGANWNTRGQVIQRTGRADDYRALLSVSLPIGRRSRARARVGSGGDVRLEYQNFGGFSVGQNQLRADISRSRNGFYSASAQLRHIANRAEFDFSHQTRDTENGVFSRSELATAIGIGFADGALQFGRPFDAGFAIVKRHETIKDRYTSLNEGGLGTAAHSDFLGPPLIPLRAGYSAYSYSIQVDDLEPGYDLGLSSVDVLPSFRAGYRVNIGSELLATALIRLVLPDGERVSLATGRIFSQDSGEEVGRFFTNRTGRLVAEKLKPGMYTIRLDGRNDLEATFTISDDASGIVQIGEITMETLE